MIKKDSWKAAQLRTTTFLYYFAKKNSTTTIISIYQTCELGRTYSTLYYCHPPDPKNNCIFWEENFVICFDLMTFFVLLLSHRQPNRHKYAKMNQTSWCKSKNARKVPNSISSSILLSSCTFGYIPSTWINTRLIHSKPQLWLESKTLVAAMMLLLCIYYLACS